MKYINVFADETAYKDASLEKPQLAYVTDGGKVYSLSIGGQPGPEPVGPAANEIWYTTTSNQPFDFDTLINTRVQQCSQYTSNIEANYLLKTQELIATNTYKATFQKNLDYVGNIYIMEGGSFVGMKIGPQFGAIGDTGSDETTITSIILPEGLTTLSHELFAYKCIALTNIKMPDSLTYIGAETFGYTNITELKIGNNVAEIQNNAFSFCTNLETAEIGNGIQTMVNAFRECTKLTSIIIHALIPPTLTDQVFGDVPENCSIYVPAASVDAYKAASGWSDRAAYIQAMPTE